MTDEITKQFAYLEIAAMVLVGLLAFCVMMLGCSIEAQEPEGPTVTQRQLEQCKLDLQVCRNVK